MNKNKVWLQPSMLMEIAHQVAKKEFKNKSFSFQQLWSLVWKKAIQFKNEKVEDWIGVFYTDLVQDKRFLIAGSNEWLLAEYVKIEDAEKIARKMYYDEKSEVYEEGFEDYKPEENSPEWDDEADGVISDITQDEDEEDK